MLPCHVALLTMPLANPEVPAGLPPGRRSEGELELDPYITHTFQGVEATNEAFHALEGGDCLRAVVIY